MLVDASGKLNGRWEPICVAGDQWSSATIKKLVASQSATTCTMEGVPNLIQIQDQNLGRRFLVDTGVYLSLLPHKSNKPCSVGWVDFCLF